MPDFARSSDPAVQHQLDRLAALSPGGDMLGLDRITRLLARLGDPHQSLPPIFHVAGTNGKGSTCAFLRAALEAAGLRVHVYTSPHLVRFNERIRLGGTLIGDEALAAVLGEVLDVSADIAPSFFEVTTAAAFLIFARTPADACVVEVGLGGRLDATNVLEAPAVTGIAQLSIDHQAFLGNRLGEIAAEKAGIAKAGVPLVTQSYVGESLRAIGDAAAAAGARWIRRELDWDIFDQDAQLIYEDQIGTLIMGSMRLVGEHQVENAGLALAMIRHQDAVAVHDAALNAGISRASWPARLQRLKRGPLVNRLTAGANVWLDGGHNPAAAFAVAAFLKTEVPAMKPLHVVCGLLANKDAIGVIRPLADRGGTFHAVPVPGHAHHAPEALAKAARAAGMQASSAANVAAALDKIARENGPPPAVLIMGSLYLAGDVLRQNEELPA